MLPGLLERCRADVLLSTGNFALRNSPIPQILLSRNSLYNSADFYRDLRSRHEYGTWLDTRLRAFFAKKSIQWANVTIAPSATFAAELSHWTGKEVVAIHHGFDHEAFTRDMRPLAPEVEEKLSAAEVSLKLLFVSHYNYYRNFETLIRALPILRNRLTTRSVKLLLTCHLAAGKNPGEYRTAKAADLVRELGVSDMIVELGSIPYPRLHQLYARSDVYVTASVRGNLRSSLSGSDGQRRARGGLRPGGTSRNLRVRGQLFRNLLCGGFGGSDIASGSIFAGVPRRMIAAGRARSRQFSWKPACGTSPGVVVQLDRLGTSESYRLEHFRRDDSVRRESAPGALTLRVSERLLRYRLGVSRPSTACCLAIND